MTSATEEAAHNDVPSITPDLTSAVMVWAHIGLLSFGGPAAQIALMHRMVVEENKWLSEKEYLNALTFCMLLPGPEAMQLATYAGWRLHGTPGGLAAGLLFVLPGAVVVLVLAAIYALYGEVALVSSLFFGIKAAVIVIVIEALLRVAKRALSLPEHWVIAVLAFVGIFFLELPYPLIILLAASYGFFRGNRQHVEVNGNTTTGTTTGNNKIRQKLPATLVTVLIWLLIWWLPIIALSMSTSNSILVDIGNFFSRLAIVTFGGAYAVLAYLAQDVVNQFGWLTAGEMMDGLGLAETTPGPLILVTEFVGFIAGYREGGIGTGLAAAVVTLWVTFVPCFLWIFAGAPYIEWISEQPRLREALVAITAAVVGVIFNLSLWFSLHVFFQVVEHKQIGVVKLWLPDFSTLDWRIVALVILCSVLAFKFHWSIFRILALSAGLGLVLVNVF